MIGRRKEWQQLQAYYNSPRAEFVALYGRRRVGKTYLVNQFFESRFAFYITGVIDGDKSEQIAAFTKGLRNIGYTVSTGKLSRNRTIWIPQSEPITKALWSSDSHWKIPTT